MRDTLVRADQTRPDEGQGMGGEDGGGSGRGRACTHQSFTLLVIIIMDRGTT